MPFLVGVLALVVALASFFVLLSPALSEAVEVGGTEIIADSEVIVHLAPSLSETEVTRAEEELAGIVGVFDVRPAAPEDIANTRRG